MTHSNPYEITRIVPSVDWISGTVKEDGRRDDLAQSMHEYLNAQLALGYEATVWKSYRYEGWRINGASWGRRDTDDIATFSGSTAHGNWQSIAPYLETCSRLDLAVTVWYKNHDLSLAGKKFQVIQQKAEDLPVQRKYTYITNLIGGDTLYVGSRQSETFGRLYDKCMQSQDLAYANSWRWEVEYHKPYAYSVLGQMDSAQNLEDFILAHVKGWFEERLVDCPFSPSSEQKTVNQIKRNPTKDEQTLEWLQDNVAKSVSKLAKKGKIKQVLEALGLTGYADELFRKGENTNPK